MTFLKQTNSKEENISLSSLVAKGAFWQFSGGLVSTVIRLGASTVLARLLDPIDFGILGMGMIAMGVISYLGNMGVGAAIIAKKNLNEEYVSTGFWLLVINRIFLYLVIFFLAPLIGFFFREPRVVSVVRVVSIVFLLSALEGIPRTMLVKNLRYKELFFIKFVSAFIEASIALLLVYYSQMKYWALIIAMLVSYSVNLLMLYSFIRWIPSCCFSRKALSSYKKYILNGLGNSIVNYLKQNIDYWVVGKLLGANSLGLYEYAYKIPHMFAERFILPIVWIIFPALSKISNDPQALSSGFLKALRMVSFITIPPLFLLVITADLFVPILWGTKWLPIIVPLKILCFLSIIQCISTTSYQIFWVYKRPDLAFKANLIQFLLTFFTVVLGGYYWGIKGIAFGMLFGTLPNVYFIKHALSMAFLKIHNFLSSLFYVLLSSIFSAGASSLIIKILSCCSINHILVLFLSLLVYFIVFIGCVFLWLGPLYRDLFDLFSKFK